MPSSFYAATSCCWRSVVFRTGGESFSLANLSQAMLGMRGEPARILNFGAAADAGQLRERFRGVVETPHFFQICACCLSAEAASTLRGAVFQRHLHLSSVAERKARVRTRR